MCGTPLATDVGSELLVKGNGMAEAKKLLAESGYDGTPIVIMAPGDVVTLKAQPVVAAQALRTAGFKVDLQATDWGTVVSRRASQKPIKEGGWNMFFTNWAGADVINPIVNFAIGGRGKNGGWFGWADDPKIEQLKDAFARAATPEEQKKIAADIQKEAFEQVIYIPLGEYTQPSAWRKSLPASRRPGTPVFWNIDKQSALRCEYSASGHRGRGCRIPSDLRLRIVRRDVFDRHRERRGIGIDLDPVHVAFERGVGPDIERGPVGADPGERERDRDVEVGRKADRRLARRSAENANRLGDVLDADVVLGKIGRAGKAAHRLSRDHADRADFAFGGRCDRVEAKQRAGRHHDLAAVLAGERDRGAR